MKIMTSQHRQSILIALAILATGCDVDIAADIYVTDIYSEKNVETPAQINFEIPSCTSERAKEYEADILSLFSASSKAKVVGCDRERMTSMLKIGVVGEVFTRETSYDFGLRREIGQPGEAEAVGVAPYVSKAFVTRAQTLMKSNMTRMDYEDITISIILNNDDAREVYVNSTSAWVDGTPYEKLSSFPLMRRAKVEIRRPNIDSDLLLRGQQPTALWIKKTKD